MLSWPGVPKLASHLAPCSASPAATRSAGTVLGEAP
jgi:hypothetical protein